MVLTAERTKQKERAIQAKATTLNLIRLSTLQGILPVEKALTFIMIIQNEKSADGQVALNSVITKAINDLQK